MRPALKILPGCEDDIISIAEWYHEQRQGLGDDFILSLYAKLNFIHNNHLTFQLHNKKYRKASLERFPYHVFYKISDGSIIIFAVLHDSRNPTLWRKVYKRLD